MAKRKRSGAQTMRRRFVFAVLGLVTVGVLLFTVFPTRTYLHQREQLQAAQKQLSLLKDVNNQLAAQSKKLNTDTEIERIAREKYGLVKPGEIAYGLLPGSGAAVGQVEQEAHSSTSQKPTLWHRIVADLTFWR